MTVICHAAWGPVPSIPARGRTLTSSHAIQDDVRNAGAIWVDRELVVHGNLVTSQPPGDSAAFTRETVSLFAAARGA
jgi:protease I